MGQEPYRRKARMKTHIIHVLCEGQTELRFVEKVLKPYLMTQNVTSVKGILVTTNKKKNALGGMVSYQHAENNLNILLSSKDNAHEHHIFTTMFDLYALPSDFPGYETAMCIADKYERVAALEAAYSLKVGDNRFVPYIQLHEFEALVLCGLNYLPDQYAGCEKRCKELTKALAESNGNPELVNDGPNTAPSKRIIRAIEDGTERCYHYNKVVTGAYITGKVGMERLRSQCRHFNEWIEKLLHS